MPPGQSGIGFLVPSDALQTVSTSQQGKSSSSPCPRAQAQFIFYREAKLFVDKNLSADVSVGSSIVASKIGKAAAVNNLVKPVEMTFEIKKGVSVGVLLQKLYGVVEDEPR